MREFYSKGSRIGVLTRLECVLGLHFFNLASGGLSPEYDEFSGPFNLVSDGFLAAHSP